MAHQRNGRRLDGFPGLRRLAALLVVLLSACATTQPGKSVANRELPAFDSRSFGERPAIAPVSRLFELSEGQASAFLDYFRDPARQAIPPHERVYEYLLLVTSDFDFHNDTRTASEVLENSSGNCLSLAILTTALANLVEVETGYLLVDSTPVFERRGDIVSKAVHVRSILYDPTPQPESGDAVAIRRPGIQFDYFPEDTSRVRVVGNLAPSAYVAMYYSNVAGEAIAAGDIDTAFWYLLESLAQEPDNAIAMNTMAVVYRRAGDEATAEQIYRYGIDTLPEKVSFLRNYRYLLKGQGRLAEAEAVDQALSRLDDPNPFTWVLAGRSALEEGEYKEAIRHFKRALDIAPYLHEAHALTAIAYLKLGKTAQGERELKYALENAHRLETKSLYQAKLAMLGR